MGLRPETYTGPRHAGTGVMRRFATQGRRMLAADDGATTVEFVVVVALVIGLSLGTFAIVGSGVSDGADRMEKCLNIQGKLHDKDLSHDKALKRIARRCGRV